MTDTRLKIVFIDFDEVRNPLINTESAQATFEISKRLVKMGHRVTVITSGYPGSKDRIEQGVMYRHVGLGSPILRLNNWMFILIMPWVTMSLTADIIVDCFSSPLKILFTPLFTSIPVVGVPVSFDTDRFSKNRDWIHRRLEKMSLKLYKYFLFTSEDLDTKIREINPQSLNRTVALGADDQLVKIKRKPEKYILFWGQLDIKLNQIDILLTAYSLISKFTPLQLIIAGVGPDEAKIRELIKDLHLQKRVKVLSTIKPEVKTKLLSEAAFMALPSLNSGFALFALEAIAAGLPVAGFATPGLRWATKRVALKARKFTVEGYAEILKDLCNKLVLKRMRKECKVFAKKFTWEKTTNIYAEFFSQVIRSDELAIYTDQSLIERSFSGSAGIYRWNLTLKKLIRNLGLYGVYHFQKRNNI